MRRRAKQAILTSKKRAPLLVALLTFNSVKIPWCSQAKYLSHQQQIFLVASRGLRSNDRQGSNQGALFFTCGSDQINLVNSFFYSLVWMIFSELFEKALWHLLIEMALIKGVHKNTYLAFSSKDCKINLFFILKKIENYNRIKFYWG
jgi:hypothetical protein